MTWRAIQVPTGIHDKTPVKPIFEQTSDKVMEAFGSWKSGNDSTPLGKSKSIVVQDEKGHTKFGASRPDTPPATGEKAAKIQR